MWFLLIIIYILVILYKKIQCAKNTLYFVLILTFSWCRVLISSRYRWEYCGILYFWVNCKKNYFRNYLCGFWIVIHEGEENSTLMLRMHGEDGNHCSAELMNNATAEMNGIVFAATYILISHFSINEPSFFVFYSIITLKSI